MIAGVSTACFYPEETESALAALAEGGVAATEIFLNCASELDPAYLRDLRRTADDAQMQILSVHPFTSGMEPMLFFSSYARRYADGREFYRRYWQAANILGAQIVVFHGCGVKKPVTMSEYVERYGTLLEDAKREGVTLCHENVTRCMSRSADFFRELSRQLPQARYVLDVKQAVRAGEDVFALAQAMGERILHVHMSDHNAGRDCLSIGEGVFNISKFLLLLDSLGFDGGAVVELYRENYHGLVELLAGYQRLCGYISTLA